MRSDGIIVHDTGLESALTRRIGEICDMPVRIWIIALLLKAVIIASAAITFQWLLSPVVIAAPLTIPPKSGITEDATKPLLLTVVSGKGTEQTGVGSGRYQMGVISEADLEPVTHAFTLRNTSPKAVTIDRVQENCYCINASISMKNEPKYLPVLLQSGAEVVIKVSLRPFLYNVSRRHSVSIFLKGQVVPAATLEMAGSQQRAVQFSQASLDFSDVSVGGNKTLPLTITMAPRSGLQVESIWTLVLRCPDPDVKIRRLSITPRPPPLVRDQEGEILQNSDAAALLDTSKPTIIRYEVTLAPTKRYGLVNTQLIFGDPRSPLLTIFRGAFIPLTGMVAGDITAMPAAVDLGLVPQGRTRAGQVILTAKSAGLLEGATVKIEAISKGAMSPEALSVDLTNPPSTAAGQDVTRKLLIVSLKTTAPPGRIEAHIIVSEVGGGELVIPISVFVVAPIPNHQN